MGRSPPNSAKKRRDATLLPRRPGKKGEEGEGRRGGGGEGRICCFYGHLYKEIVDGSFTDDFMSAIAEVDPVW